MDPLGIVRARQDAAALVAVGDRRAVAIRNEKPDALHPRAQRALDAVPAEAKAAADPGLKALIEGVERAATPEEARQVVGKYHEAGFQQIKIYSLVTPPIVEAICAEAHRLGMTVTGHVPESMNSIDAVEAGMDQLSHLNFVATGFVPKSDKGRGNDLPLALNLESQESLAALRLFKERGTVIDPTLAVLELMTRPKNVAIEAFEPGMAKVAPELLGHRPARRVRAVFGKLLAEAEIGRAMQAGHEPVERNRDLTSH